MSESPRVSVILPAYNEAKYIRRSVNSILAQTFVDFELILLDDGSDDGTWEIIQTFDDPRIRPIKLDRQGFSNALNHGLQIACGEYIARMDADDESLPMRFERQVTFLDANPDITVLGTAYYKYDAMRDESYIRIHPQNDSEIRNAMALYHPICHGAVMFRRTLVEKVGGYNNILAASDLDLWLRAAPYFRFANLDTPLYVYWFDPSHSYFELSLGRFRRAWVSVTLHARAIRELQMPKYYYALLVARWVYYIILPNRIKRLVRRLVSKSEEIPIPSQMPET